MSLTFYRPVWEGIQRDLDRGMQDYMDFMMHNWQEWVNTPYPPASSPHYPPHRRTGEFHDSIFWFHTPGDGHYFLASSDKKAVWLELGTRNMEPRPSIMPLIEAYKGLTEKMIARHVQP